MEHTINIKVHIGDMLQASRFAVLATEGNGQPHASLIAITPTDDYRSMIFATYRNTRKYLNLAHNSQVAVLIEGENINRSALQEGFVLTAFGHAHEISPAGHDVTLRAHLDRHPDLELFMQSKECALIRVTVEAYQVVNGIDDATWYPIKELNTCQSGTGTVL